MSERWEEGKYQGCKLKGAAVTTIGKNASPCMVLLFDVAGHEKEVRCWLNPDVNPGKKRSALEISEERLAPLGFNWDYAAPAFTSADEVELELKYETFEGKEQERWDFPFVRKPASPAFVEQLNRRARAVHGAPKAAPPGRPAPPPAAVKAAPPATAGGPDPRLAEMAKAADKATAWAFWELMAAPGKPNLDDWHKAVDAAGPDEDKFTASQWQKVAGACLPF